MMQRARSREMRMALLASPCLVEDKEAWVNPLSKVLRGPSGEDLAGGVKFVEDIERADAVVLPSLWTRYATCAEKKAEVAGLAKELGKTGKPLLVWHAGDLRPVLPFERRILFSTAVNRSQREPDEFAVPPFFPDPLEEWSAGRLRVREKGVRPTVGFCGYAIQSPLRFAYSIIRNSGAVLRYGLRKSEFEAPQLLPAAHMRAKVLERLQRDGRIETRFILRENYRAGLRKAEPRHKSVQEFFNNIFDTDYTVCMRGYGNWSVRLYETLACGRIPVLLDANGGLPYDWTVDWKRYCVWVPARDWRSMADHIHEFHASLTPEQFVERQSECRRFWEERLSFSGFFKHFDEHFAHGAAKKASETGGHVPSRRELRVQRRPV